MPYGPLNPTLASILHRVALDVEYVRGEGCSLWDAEGTHYLDFLAQYGALPFGYNPPPIVEAVVRALRDGVPSFVQPSKVRHAGLLAERLIELAPGDLAVCIFSSTGDEAVGVALKAARAATGKSLIVSTHNSFHGKNAALSVTGRDQYRQPFLETAPRTVFVPFDDLEALSDTLTARGRDVAAVIVEPVQGEAGAVVPTPGYLSGVEALCQQHGVLLIVDEVQTGLGRVGSLFACDQDRLRPDILVLGKALGGGLFPLSATLLAPGAWTEALGRLHSSTFGNNNLGCVAGLAVLDLLTADDGRLIREAAARGTDLIARLRRLQAAYPDVIEAVRGQGLMIAADVAPMDPGQSFVFAYADQVGVLGLVLCSILLNVDHLRVGPFLSRPRALRIEPPLIVTAGQVDCLVRALDRLAETMQRRDYARLADVLVQHVVVKGMTPCSA